MLASEANRSVGISFRIAENVLTVEEQLIAKFKLNLFLHDGLWKEIIDVHEVIA